MDELVRWLGEQLDEDEKVAFTAGHTLAGELALRWAAVSSYVYPEEVTDNEPPVAGAPLMSDMPGYEVARARALHIAEHDPARVLREIDAKRQLLDAYAAVAENDVDEYEYAHGWANALGHAVRLLAAAYADRPGYKAEEWSP